MKAHKPRGKLGFRTGQAGMNGFPISRWQREIRGTTESIFYQIISEIHSETLLNDRYVVKADLVVLMNARFASPSDCDSKKKPTRAIQRP
jgi:hypothetical protein